MCTVADVIRQIAPGYLRRFGHRLLPSHRRALGDILRCRTPAMGGHVLICETCGREHHVYHSCRNRNCPVCQANHTRQWLDKRRGELLPVGYFHVIFTVPAEIRPVIRQNQKLLYGVLMRSAADALQALADDPHYVGGQLATLAVLHTWGRNLSYHPHVHCLVAGGGLDPNGRWRPARDGFLVPVKALSKVFRGLFLHRTATLLPDLAIPDAARCKDWVVHSKPPVRGRDNVLRYLGRYVHRVALGNHRPIELRDGKVAFAYRPAGQTRRGRPQTLALGAHDFLHRFLQHVLPKGFHKVRFYGLWAPVNRKKLRTLQQQLPGQFPGATPDPTETAQAPAFANAQPAAPGTPFLREGCRCPDCGIGILRFVQRLVPQPLQPP